MQRSNEKSFKRKPLRQKNGEGAPICVIGKTNNSAVSSLWFNKKTDELLNETASSVNGISSDEAQKRLAKYGKNELEIKKRKSFLLRFLSGMCDRMTLILLAAAAISFVTSFISGEGYADPIMILLIVVINSFIAAVQENKAEKALEALSKMSSPETNVIRDGNIARIKSSDVVPGDVFVLEKGDIIPCDARILSGDEITVDESALTGESLPVSKNIADNGLSATSPMECKNSVFSSTSVVTGRGTALAVKTGMETALGAVAGMISGDPEPTPLQKRLARLGTLLGNITLALCALMLIVSVLRGMDFGEMFMTSVSLSVAAIPEGLPAIVTVVLSVGVQTLANKNAVVKRLPAVETLGRAQIICTDKTGTLTCNRMTVTDIYGEREKLLRAFALCNNDSSPTERALTEYSADISALRNKYTRIREIPFDSAKKYMITVSRSSAGYVTHIKGAPDVVSRFCGEERLISGITAEYTKRALRVMCFAECETAYPPSDPNSLKFKFIGLCGMTDPPRDGVENSVALCKKAGVRTVMLTGDHKDTALAVAIKTGIANSSSVVYTESELNRLSAREFDKALSECNVFARVTPAFKLRVVEHFKSKGLVVAMTGDGVNDAPALKKASIGCAMGIGGTEAAKESADMILADDDFNTIVSAVREGRGIYDNIRRAVHFLLSCNIGELFTMFFSMIIMLPSPLSAIQLLWVNLTTDSLPAIALGLEKTGRDAMDRPPISPKSPLFSLGSSVRMALEGILIGSLAISAFVIGKASSGFLTGRTMCFIVLSVSQLFHSFNMRSEKSIFSKGLGCNPYLLAAFAVCFIMQVSVVLIPGAAALFGVASLSLTQWITALLLSSAPLVLTEIYKLLKYILK